MAMTNAGSSTQITAPERSSGSGYRNAFVMVTTLFFVWGFLTSLNDILIPHLKAIFDLNYAEAMLVQFAFFSSYAAFGIPSGKVVEWIGYQRTMVLGSAYDGRRRGAVYSGGEPAFVPALSGSADRTGGGHYGAAGCGESLCDGVGSRRRRHRAV